MTLRVAVSFFVCLAILTPLMVTTVTYATHGMEGIIVTPQGSFQSLDEAMIHANPGDVIDVYGGTSSGPIIIDKPLHLRGHNWPILDGNNSGTVIQIRAPGTLITGFVIRNSGKSLDEENSGIAVESPNVTVQGNRLQETLFGIYLRKASGSTIRDNVIRGKELDLPRRGDPIRIWFSNDVVVENNTVTLGRDVVLWYSERLTVINNDISGGRYGLHFMYCDDAVISKNRLIDNSVGAFLMYSRRLNFQNNFLSNNRGASGFGIGMKDLDDAVVSDNLFLDNRIGAALDNSPREIDSTVLFDRNVFSFNDIGIRFMPSVRRNQFTKNTFKENLEHVTIAGGGNLHDNVWTVNGIGNYWGDYAGFDENGDGHGDIPYESRRFFEDLMQDKPRLRLFLFSPAAQALDFAARALPSIRPAPKLIDEAPLMAMNLPDLPPRANIAASSMLGPVSAGMLLLVTGLVFTPLRAVQAKPKDEKSRPARKPIGLKVDRLTKRFGKATVIENLTFEITAGESVALWGSNGAGKTTILRCLLGLLPHEGDAFVGNLNLSKNGKECRGLLGFVPQQLHLHEGLTVLETMQFYAKLKKAPTKAIAQRLERMELYEDRSKLVGQLSGGMRQKLALALALLKNPPILVLDEPTASLDIRSRAAFLATVAQLKKEGKTLLFASHRLEDVLTLADRVLIIESGRLAADCIPRDLESLIQENTLLRIYLPKHEVRSAASVLSANKVPVSVTESAILAQVPLAEKFRPLAIVSAAGFTVINFDVEPLPNGGSQ